MKSKFWYCKSMAYAAAMAVPFIVFFGWFFIFMIHKFWCVSHGQPDNWK